MASILELPDKVLLNILGNLSTRDLCVLAGACQKMQSLVENHNEEFRQRLVITSNYMQKISSKGFSRLKTVGLTGIILLSHKTNFLQRTMELSMPILQEIVFHDCTVPWESLSLKAIPETVKTLKISAVKVIREKCQADGWFSNLVMNLDQQRKSLACKLFYRKTHCLTNLEWRTHGVGNVEFSEYEKSVNFTTPPLKIEVKTDSENESPLVLHQSSNPDHSNRLCYGLAKKLMNRLHPMCSTNAPFKITGLSWYLDCEGFANLVILRSFGNHVTTNSSLLMLPNEVLLQILEFLDIIDICSMAMTCKRIGNLTAHASLPRIISDEKRLKKDKRDLRKSAGMTGLSVSLLDLFNLSTMPNLSELVIHDCKLLIEDLKLSNFPCTLLRLKLSHLHICQEEEKGDDWLVYILRELEKVRNQLCKRSGIHRHSSKISHQGILKLEQFQYRTRQSEPMSLNTIVRVVTEMKCPFQLAMWSGLQNTTTVLGTDLDAELIRNYITNYSPFKTMRDDCERPDGFLWEMIEEFKATFAITIWDYLSGVCTKWN